MEDDLPVILRVYQSCEDFLALGPVATASIEMVSKDLEISKEEDGIFCGIYTEHGNMVGVVDYVPSNFQGDSHAAFLSLRMVAAPFRSQGIGKAVAEAIENEIRKDKSVTVIFLGVQVNNQTTVFDLRKVPE